ncbi:MAG: biotin--[acetyl-CoA-carboxylase] ligase [Anaerolineae bacterium]|nr:biotin--[acetyl-CoA-carboxylase] ligase [Ardenticatenia bacterium]
MNLPPLAADLDAARLRAALAGCPLGLPLEVHAELASTMDRLARLADAGAPSGAMVIADQQTAGRGRLGRSWQAEPGQALMFSLLLRPPPALQSPERLAQLPMALALGALAALRLRLPDPSAAALKWPNDLLLAGRKAAGMLTELAWDEAGPRVIVGLGLNLRQRAFPGLPDATSLALALQAAVEDEDPRLHRGDLAADLLRAAAAELARLAGGEALTPRWAAELATLGRWVRVRRLEEDGGVLEGLAEGVAADGALLLRTEAGVLLQLRAGDVSLSGG